MRLGVYLGFVDSAERELAEAFDQMAERHAEEPDVRENLTFLASWSRQHLERLAGLLKRYGESPQREPRRLARAMFGGLLDRRSGGVGLVRDLHDLWLLASEVHMGYIVLEQAGQGLRDPELETGAKEMGQETYRQIGWLRTRIKAAAPQALIAAK
jgi:hypothetical protein